MKVALLQARDASDNTFLTPVGILYIAASLRQAGHDVFVFDGNLDVSNIYPILREFNPGIVGFSLMTTYYRRTDATVRRLRQELPNALICAGGIHPSALPDRTLVELGGGLDFVVVGEGELVMVELCRRIEAGEDYLSLPGTVHQRDHAIIDNGRATAIDNLDLLPFPARDLLGMEPYLTPPGPIKGYPLVRSTNMIASRGCKAACTFCGNQVLFSRSIRRRSANNIIAEIEHLVNEYDLNGFQFTDDVFLSDHEWVKEFCSELIDRDLDHLRWVGNSRANMLNDEVAALLFRAGCRQLEIGVESGSDRILKVMKKGITKKVIKRGYDVAKRNGLRRMASFIVGFPTETLEDIKMTAAFSKEIKPDFASFFFLTPFPGSEVYDDAVKNGWIPEDHNFMDDNWSIRSAETPYMSIDLSSAELVKLRASMQNRFFLRNFLTNISMSFIFTLAWALIVQPAEIFRIFGRVWRTGRLDYVAEGALNAYRTRIERRRPRQPGDREKAKVSVIKTFGTSEPAS